MSRKWIEWAEWAASLCTANSPFPGHVYRRHPVDVFLGSSGLFNGKSPSSHTHICHCSSISPSLKAQREPRRPSVQRFTSKQTNPGRERASRERDKTARERSCSGAGRRVMGLHRRQPRQRPLRPRRPRRGRARWRFTINNTTSAFFATSESRLDANLTLFR